MEIQLIFDENGRTTYDPKTIQNSTTTQKEEDDDDDDDDSNDKNMELNYDTKSTRTSFYTNDTTTIINTTTTNNDDVNDDLVCSPLDDLLLDCEIADVGLLPRTFWIPCDAEPRCALEKIALQIFRHHIPNKNYIYDKNTSGAEWWVQIRPSPNKSGRYSMLVEEVTDDTDVSDEKNSISLHWDKDEELRMVTKHTSLCFIHPHISTVTYLTNYGAPTIIIEDCLANANGLPTNLDSSPPTPCSSSTLSYPKQGKHISFDGRFLHGAISELTLNPTPPIEIEDSTIKHTPQQKKEIRKSRRVTFLVNVWFNYKPLGVDLFPHTMLDKMSSVDSTNSMDPLFATNSQQQQQERPCDTIIDSSSCNTNDSKKTYAWEIGHDCDDEFKCELQVTLPDPFIDDNFGSTSGNVKINCEDDDGDRCPCMSFELEKKQNIVMSTIEEEEE